MNAKEEQFIYKTRSKKNSYLRKCIFLYEPKT